MDIQAFAPYLQAAASGLMFFSVILGIYALAPQPVEEDENSDYVPLVHRGQMGAKRAHLKETFLLYAVSLPLITSLAKLISMLPLEGLRAGLRKKLIQAGNPGAYTPDEYLAIPLITMVLFPLLFFGVANSVEAPLPAEAFLLVGLIGLGLPFLSLNDRIRKRQREINRSLPFTLDMLTLSIEAGLDFITAIERIVTKRSNQGAISEEFYQMLQELKMGKTRKEALRDMARRVGLDSLNSVVANLVQAEQLGTPLGPILRIQSEMLRVKRSQMAEKAAMEASVKLLFPLLFIFVAVFIIILAPIAISLQGTLL